MNKKRAYRQGGEGGCPKDKAQPGDTGKTVRSLYEPTFDCYTFFRFAFCDSSFGNSQLYYGNMYYVTIRTYLLARPSL